MSTNAAINTIPELAALIIDLRAELVGHMNDIRNDLEVNFTGQIGRIENNIKTIENRQDLFDEKLEELERKTHLTDLIMDGIPLIPKEDLRHIFHSICIKLGFLSNEHTLASIFRLRNNRQNSQPSIVIKFVSTTARNEFFGLYIKCLNLNLRDIGFEHAVRIYIKESLTKRNANIFSKAVQARKNNLLSSVHTFNGYVYIRTEKGGKSFRLHSVDDLPQFTGLNPSDYATSKRKLNLSAGSMEIDKNSNEAKVIKTSTRNTNPRVMCKNISGPSKIESPTTCGSASPKPSGRTDNPFKPNRPIFSNDILPKRNNSIGTLDRYLSKSKDTICDENTVDLL